MTASEPINSLKIANPSFGQGLDLNGNTLNLTSGGLLFTGANSFNIVDSIGTGALTGGNNANDVMGPYDLVLHQYNSGGVTISAIIANNGGNPTALTMAGTGTTYLAAANTYTGPTCLAGGVLSLTNPAALGGSTAITFAGGSLQYGVGGVPDISSKIVNSSGPITIDTGVQSVTFSGSLAASNSGGLLKLGAGTLTIPLRWLSANPYVGPTVIAAGTLVIANSGNAALGTGPLTVESNAVLDILPFARVRPTLPNALNGNGTINLALVRRDVRHDAPQSVRREQRLRRRLEHFLQRH